jgi:hypothetical protein
LIYQKWASDGVLPSGSAAKRREGSARSCVANEFFVILEKTDSSGNFVAAVVRAQGFIERLSGGPCACKFFQAFCQAFCKFFLFLSSFSEDSLGDFVEFQGVTRRQARFSIFQIF